MTCLTPHTRLRVGLECQGKERRAGLGLWRTHGVLERQETVADPAAGGPVTADVGESLVQVAVRSTKGDLFDGLVYQQVLGKAGRPREECELAFMYSPHIP